MLSLQSTGTFPWSMIVFIKSAMISQQISGAAFNISTTTPEDPAAFLFFMCLKDFNMSSEVMNCAGPVTGLSYGSFWNHRNSIFNNPSCCFHAKLLWCVIKGKYLHHLVCISDQLHPDFLYAFVWWHKNVSFIVFSTSKLLLFCISLSCVDGMLCFPFCIQIFIFLPLNFHNFHNLSSQIYPY